MKEALFIRRDGDGFTGLPDSRQSSLIDQLRLHLSPQEAQMFGIDQTYEQRKADTPRLTALLTGVGATAATSALFAVFGFLATLGLSEPALAAIPAIA